MFWSVNQSSVIIFLKNAKPPKLHIDLRLDAPTVYLLATHIYLNIIKQMQLPLSYRALTPELSRKHMFVSANLLRENGLEYIKGSNLQESSSKQSHSDALTIFFM